MKAKAIIFIVIMVIGLAVYGYFKAVPGIQNQTENKPQIEINPKIFDFGEVKYGDVASHVFKVRNTGEQVLEIKKVATSCACTEAEIEKKRLGPNEEVNLTVTYNTGAMSGSHAKGKQERIIYIKSNDPKNPQIEAIISAYVK